MRIDLKMPQLKILSLTVDNASRSLTILSGVYNELISSIFSSIFSDISIIILYMNGF